MAVGLLCILGAGCWLVASRAIDGVAFSPLGTFVSAWLVSLGLYYFNFLGYRDLSTLTELVVTMVLGSFVLGALTVRLGLKHPGQRTNNTGGPATTSRPVPMDGIAVHRVLGLATLLAGASLTGVFLNARYVAGVLQANIAEVYSYSFDLLGVYAAPAWVGSLTTLGIPVLPVCLTVYPWASGLSRYYIGFLSLVTMGGLALYSFRSYLFYSGVWGAFVYLFFSKRRLARRVVVVGLLAMALFSYFVGYAAVTREFSGSPVLTAYHYVAANFPALDNLLHDTGGLSTRGVLTFRPLLRALNLVAPSAVDLPPHVAPFTSTPLPTNTYTFLREFYLDFGLVGLALIPWLIGASSTYLMNVFLSTRSPGLLLLSGLVSMWMVFSPFTNQFVMPKQWTFAALSLIVGHLASARRKAAAL